MDENSVVKEENDTSVPKREVKTRFPVARIKRLMQSDDEIGKVAQATPVVVAKALELFMVALVDASCSEARSRNSKRVSPAHLKQAVLNTEQFDFLADLMSKYPDPVAGGSKKEKKAAAAAAAAAASSSSSTESVKAEPSSPAPRRTVIRPEDL